MVRQTTRIAEEESSTEAGPALRWSVEQRLAFIEERLFWLGEVNRNDVVRRFGVSMSQASGDIARYLARDPPGLAYDKSAKRYVAGAGFRPVLSPPDAGRFLGELRLLRIGVMAESETMLGMAPAFDATPLPERRVDAFVVRAVLGAIRERQALNVRYQSMSRPEPTRRTIEPHAFVHDGFRWHARAFDRETGDFRDFVLGRMSEPGRGEPAGSNPADDLAWNEIVELRVAPHPGLTPAQAKAIRLDYGIKGRHGTIAVRRALLFYALKRLGLDVPADTRPPHEQHIVLVNRTEIEAIKRNDREA